ncbi:hypothetical protein ACHAWF_004295 [Thalassiosira exigua]
MLIVNDIVARGWLSDNPDSVGGLLSIHLNLMTNGKSLFEQSDDDDERGEGASKEGEEGEMSLRRCISDMVVVLRPHLYNFLLPAGRTMTNSSSVEIFDVFIRHYGVTKDDADGNEGRATTQNRLTAHYDVTAFATYLIALDSTSSLGRNGLYATPPTMPTAPGALVKGATCGHASMRKFVPLDKGDGVVHTYDVLHVVDVDPGLKRCRTSLIVWFTDNGNKARVNGAERVGNRSWLQHPADDVSEFVAAIAAETAAVEQDKGLDAPPNALLNVTKQYELYLASASRGSGYALTSLA